MQIDATTYRKDSLLPVGQGYGTRPGGIAPSSIVIHTTSNGQPTSFAFEATYLQKSREVSAHFLIGKAGQIVQFLSPDLLAWHAGVALAPWTNEHSIGIEHHISVGETWTEDMHAASTWLVTRLMAQYRIPATMIETHRAVALPGPNIRKHDPEGFSDAAFYAWRRTLAVPTFRVKGLPVYQRTDLVGIVAGYLSTGDIVTIDATYPNGAAHLASGLGFVDADALEAL